MHEFGRFIQALMDQESMSQADLMRRTGLSRQYIWMLLTEPELKRLPGPAKFEALGRAFPGVSPDALVLSAAAAMGIPVTGSVEVDYSSVSNETLLGILRDRLEAVEGFGAEQGGSSDGRQPDAEKMTPGSRDADAIRSGDDDPIELTRPVTRLTPKHERMLRDAQEMDTAAYEGEDPEGGR